MSMATTITSLTPTPMSALPTPPFTPAGPIPQHTHLLDSLIAHYQRERMWVKNTQEMIYIARQQLQHGVSADRTNASATASNGTGIPLWQRRKSRHSLHLSDIAHSKLSKRLLSHGAYSTKVLDSFAALLDARIESCKRMEILVAKSVHRRRHRPR